VVRHHADSEHNHHALMLPTAEHQHRGLPPWANLGLILEKVKSTSSIACQSGSRLPSPGRMMPLSHSRICEARGALDALNGEPGLVSVCAVPETLPHAFDIADAEQNVWSFFSSRS
jgi:hypothetical protein